MLRFLPLVGVVCAAFALATTASAATAPSSSPPPPSSARRKAEQVKKLKENVDHIVIFMQENRAFDHYYGTLNGVRGYNDRVTIPMLNQQPSSFYQATSTAPGYMLPFHMKMSKTSAVCAPAPEMNFFCDTMMRNKGRYDSWNTARDPGFGMGFFTREDLPFYYTLYDNFCVGDQYFQSTLTETNPNRLHLFSGSNGLSVGQSPKINNDESTPNLWPTVAEILQNATVSWKVYQEADNFDDNGFAWFKTFQDAKPGNPLYDNGMVHAASLVDAFAADVTGNNLPAVSWIVAPTNRSEHAQNHPVAGEDYSAQILKALQANPKLYARAIFILNYDEGGQFFDHHWTPNPPINGLNGASTVTTVGEVLPGFKAPMGLGFRVPLLLISPWSRGRKVYSQTLDHTSVIKLLELRFDVHCPNISPWRRLVTGDFLNAFDFDHPDYSWPTLPDTSAYVQEGQTECDTLPLPTIPSVQAMPAQEEGLRASAPLPFNIDVAEQVVANETTAALGFTLTIANQDDAQGVALIFFDELQLATVDPKQYAVGPLSKVDDVSTVPVNVSATVAYAFNLYGPNGFSRQFAARKTATSVTGLEATVMLTSSSGVDGLVQFNLVNNEAYPVMFIITDNAYGTLKTNMSVTVGAKSTESSAALDLTPSQGWYDWTVTSLPATAVSGDDVVASAKAALFLRRFMGHMEIYGNGVWYTSDPAMGKHVPVATTALVGLTTGEANREQPTVHPNLPENLTVVKRTTSRPLAFRGQNLNLPVHKDAAPETVGLKREEL